MSEKKVQSQEEVCDLQLAAYYKGRARSFLDGLLIPLIRQECKNERKTQDVASSPAMQFLVSAVTGSQAGKADLPN